MDNNNYNNNYNNGYNNNYNNNSYNNNYNQPYNNYNNYQGNSYGMQENNSMKDLGLIFLLTWFTGIVGLIVGALKHSEAQGKNKENIAHLLNFYISYILHVFISIIIIFAFGISTVIASEILVLIMLIPVLLYCVILIGQWISLISVAIKVLKKKDLKKTPFAFKFFKY